MRSALFDSIWGPLAVAGRRLHHAHRVPRRARTAARRMVAQSAGAVRTQPGRQRQRAGESVAPTRAEPLRGHERSSDRPRVEERPSCSSVPGSAPRDRAAALSAG